MIDEILKVIEEKAIKRRKDAMEQILSHEKYSYEVGYIHGLKMAISLIKETSSKLIDEINDAN